jgi:hypothetical protein
MLIKLKPKTPHGVAVVKKHGRKFRVLDISIGVGEYLKEPAFRVHSMKKTAYKPFVGWKSYWFWLPCEGNNHFDFLILKDEVEEN